MSESLRLVMAQLDMRVGDVAGNARQVIDAAVRARDELQADLIVFPELSFTGYPPEDLLHRQDFINTVGQAIAEVRDAVSGITLVVGFPHAEGGRLYNSAAVFQDDAVFGIYHKHHLANVSVFDDKRYFESGNQALVFSVKGLRFGVSICEDLWHPGPYDWAVEEGAQAVININASPFHSGKAAEREQVIRDRQKGVPLPVVYVNLVGGQDEVVYDGVSCVYDASGELVVRAPAFDEGLFPVDFRVDGARLVPLPGEVSDLPGDDALIYQALVRGTRDYVNKNGFPSVVLGLSGGIDSAMAAAIAVDALGAERVHAVMLPSRYTSQESLEDAAECAQLLGISYESVSIEAAFEGALGELRPLFGQQPEDVTEENLQSRCRGLMLMALSNKLGHMLLTTGNKSEYAVGYATLYGDMCGGFAPLKDVYKTLLYRLARLRNRAGEVIPERIITKAPTAELRPDQKDEDSLPPYPVLDDILARYVDDDSSIDAIVACGHEHAVVCQVVGLLHRSEYKRRQSAPGVKITRKAFGRERRYPITSGYQPWK
ncbi:NAD+ synthase (glutamine-hydrolyzing) [Natronocella acetinitrilica]|uniref:Glutamine-dependent NAD(+) synthetase n=1 Tax=Natronocella acetinitrilica TaxID=414046 RepID=A0AAE3KA40_9GAMM|nr:NAD+ synthase [Natronocella acetinitrilica]MCP1672921.1 NAD+ synthase (glutamine-hydrolyzing) [Natronocella acetinitrilica]